MYQKYLKHGTAEDEINCNNNRRLFESVKQTSKMIFFFAPNNSREILRNVKNLKEVTGKPPKTHPFLQANLLLTTKYDEKQIPNKFNNFFVDTGPELAKEILRPRRFLKAMYQNLT